MEQVEKIEIRKPITKVISYLCRQDRHIEVRCPDGLAYHLKARFEYDYIYPDGCQPLTIGDIVKHELHGVGVITDIKATPISPRTARVHTVHVSFDSDFRELFQGDKMKYNESPCRHDITDASLTKVGQLLYQSLLLKKIDPDSAEGWAIVALQGRVVEVEVTRQRCKELDPFKIRMDEMEANEIITLAKQYGETVTDDQLAEWCKTEVIEEGITVNEHPFWRYLSAAGQLAVASAVKADRRGNEFAGYAQKQIDSRDRGKHEDNVPEQSYIAEF